MLHNLAFCKQCFLGVEYRASTCCPHCFRWTWTLLREVLKGLHQDSASIWRTRCTLNPWFLVRFVQPQRHVHWVNAESKKVGQNKFSLSDLLAQPVFVSIDIYYFLLLRSKSGAIWYCKNESVREFTALLFPCGLSPGKAVSRCSLESEKYERMYVPTPWLSHSPRGPGDKLFALLHICQIERKRNCWGKQRLRWPRLCNLRWTIMTFPGWASPACSKIQWLPWQAMMDLAFPAFTSTSTSSAFLL